MALSRCGRCTSTRTRCSREARCSSTERRGPGPICPRRGWSSAQRMPNGTRSSGARQGRSECRRQRAGQSLDCQGRADPRRRVMPWPFAETRRRSWAAPSSSTSDLDRAIRLAALVRRRSTARSRLSILQLLPGGDAEPGRPLREEWSHAVAILTPRVLRDLSSPRTPCKIHSRPHSAVAGKACRVPLAPGSSPRATARSPHPPRRSSAQGRAHRPTAGTPAEDDVRRDTTIASRSSSRVAAALAAERSH